MRTLGLDVGERRMGVALSDTLGITAQRLTVIERSGIEADVKAVQELVEKHGVDTVVMGLPLGLRGTRGAQAQRITAFAKRLGECLNIPVQLIDERFTTAQGERALLEMGTSRRKRKHVIDTVAAQLILQQYLERKRQE